MVFWIMCILKRVFIIIGEKDKNISGFVGGRECFIKLVLVKYRNIFNVKLLIKKGGLLFMA